MVVVRGDVVSMVGGDVVVVVSMVGVDVVVVVSMVGVDMVVVVSTVGGDVVLTCLLASLSARASAPAIARLRTACSIDSFDFDFEERGGDDDWGGSSLP